MSNRFTYEPYFVSRSVLEARAGINSSDLAKLDIPTEDRGVDLYEVLGKLRKKWMSARKAVGDDENLDSMKLETDIKSEKLLKDKINNQFRLGMLIPKTEAINRQLRFQTFYRELQQEAIRTMSQALTGTPTPDNGKPTTRAWTEYFTIHYNKLIDAVRKTDLEIMNWEEDGSHKLLRTRLMSAQTENDIDRILTEQGSVHYDEDKRTRTSHAISAGETSVT